jgi:hypothetical protein
MSGDEPQSFEINFVVTTTYLCHSRLLFNREALVSSAASSDIEAKISFTP